MIQIRNHMLKKQKKSRFFKAMHYDIPHCFMNINDFTLCASDA